MVCHPPANDSEKPVSDASRSEAYIKYVASALVKRAASVSLRVEIHLFKLRNVRAAKVYLSTRAKACCLNSFWALYARMDTIFISVLRESSQRRNLPRPETAAPT